VGNTTTGNSNTHRTSLLSAISATNSSLITAQSSYDGSSGVTRVGDTPDGNWGYHPSIFLEKPGDLFYSPVLRCCLFSPENWRPFFAHQCHFLLISLRCHPLEGVTPHLFYLSDLVSPLFFAHKKFSFLWVSPPPGGCHPGRSPRDATGWMYIHATPNIPTINYTTRQSLPLLTLPWGMPLRKSNGVTPLTSASMVSAGTRLHSPSFLSCNHSSYKKHDHHSTGEQGRINHLGVPNQRKAGPFSHTHSQGFLRRCTFSPKKVDELFLVVVDTCKPTLNVQTSKQRVKNFGSWSGTPWWWGPLPWYNRHNG